MCWRIVILDLDCVCVLEVSMLNECTKDLVQLPSVKLTVHVRVDLPLVALLASSALVTALP